MYRYFEKHGKKTLAFFGVFLMLAFLLPTSGLHCGGSMGQAGSVNGRPIPAHEIEVARQRLRALHNFIVTDPQTGVPDNAFNRIFGFGNPMIAERLYQILSENELAWFLLATEAANNFTIASESEVDQFFTPQANPQVITQERPKLIIQPLTNPPAVENMKQNVRIALAVRDQFLRSLNKIKVSTPRLNESLARNAQQIKARIALFDANDYLSSLPAPTDEELLAQFQAFAAVAPGSVSETNPFGFGYRIPDQVRLQWIAVPQSEIEQAVLGSKSDFEWEEEARVYFGKHWEQFVEKSPSTSESSTQPSTEPTSAPVKPSFESVRDKVYDTIRKPLIEQKRRTVVNIILDLLNEDYNRISNANPAPTTQAVFQFKARDQVLSSYEYLQKVADEVKRRQGVVLEVENHPQLLTQSQLQIFPGIGQALVEEVGPRDRQIPSATYLFSSLTTLNPSADPAMGMLGLLQPSRPLWTPQRTYIARVVQAIPSHPPTQMQEVKEQLVRDVQRRNAFAKAVEEAEAAIEQARRSGLASLSKTVFTTDWFGSSSFSIPGLPPESSSYARLLVQPIYNLLRQAESTGDLPIRSVVKAQQADKVAAVEIFDVRTLISTEDEDLYRLFGRRELMMNDVRELNLLVAWFTPDNIAKRVKYVSPHGSGPEREKTPVPAPNRPFIPG